MTDSKRKVISFLAADKNYNAAEEQSRNIIGQRIAQYRKENKMSRPEFYDRWSTGHPQMGNRRRNP